GPAHLLSVAGVGLDDLGELAGRRGGGRVAGLRLARPGGGRGLRLSVALHGTPGAGHRAAGGAGHAAAGVSGWRRPGAAGAGGGGGPAARAVRAVLLRRPGPRATA